jgi:D-3-phosphoglycerate dehydrogenase
VLPPKPGHVGGRLCIVNKNEAGVLGQITTFLGTQNVNIEQQINTSRGDIAYTVLDLSKIADPAGLQAGLAKACPGVISSRFIGNMFDDEMGKPGTFFYVKWASQ